MDCYGANQKPPTPRRRGGVSLAVALAFIVAAAADPPPSLVLDPNFKPSLTTSVGVELTAVALQSHGRLLVAGRFDLFHGHPFNGCVRLDASGRVDRDFAFWPCVQGIVHAVAVQPDDKILLGGEFGRVGGRTRWGLARLNPDGSLDAGFAPVLDQDRPSIIRVVRLDPDGRIWIGGDFRMVGPHTRGGIARLKPDGTVDEAFDPGVGVEDGFGVVHDLALLPSGGVVVAGLFTKFSGQAHPGLVRLDAQGVIDETFDPQLDWSMGLVSVYRVRAQENGRLLIAGRFDRVGTEIRTGLARVLPSGAPDESFEVGGGWGGGADDPVHDLIVLDDGSILVAGEFDGIGDSPCRGVARLRPNGSVDRDFQAGEGLRWQDGTPGTGIALARHPDGCVLVAGAFEQLGSERRQHFGRLLPDGQVDASYSAPDLLIERAANANVIRVQPDGFILVGGDFQRANGQPRQALARFSPIGRLDGGFDAAIGPGGVVNAIALDAAGDILIGGRFETVRAEPRANLARLSPRGHLDASFDLGNGPDGEVYCVVLQPDGQVLVSGDFDSVNGIWVDRVARIEANGRLDRGFKPSLSVHVDRPEVYDIAVHPDGRMILAGYFDEVNGAPRSGLARLHPDGTLDSSYGPGSLIGGDLPLVTHIALMPNGGQVVIGLFNSIDGQPRRGIGRLDPDGNLDPTFDPGDGIGGGEIPAVYGLAVEPTGSLFLVGEFDDFDHVERQNLARVTAAGRLDTGFAPAGCTDSWALAAAAQPDGSILVGGPFTTFAGQPRQGIARFRPFDPDHPTVDIRLEEGTTVVSWLGPATLQSSDSLLGPWRDEADAASPANVPHSHPTRFFRLVR